MSVQKMEEPFSRRQVRSITNSVLEVMMKSNYVGWIKDNWQKSAILVLIYIVVSIAPLYTRLELVEFLLLLAFPLYLAHEIEEYILPGGFGTFFNENLLKVNSDEKIVPVDREVVFWINLIYIWLVLPLFSGLGFYNIKFAAWIPYFFLFQAIGHLGMGIKGKKIMNPGIRTSILLHVPYSLMMIHLLSYDVFINPYINPYMIIGFVFNALLPVFAKFIIMPRYHRRLSDDGRRK